LKTVIKEGGKSIESLFGISIIREYIAINEISELAGRGWGEGCFCACSVKKEELGWWSVIST
jgi:hypothetical protein